MVERLQRFIRTGLWTTGVLLAAAMRAVRRPSREGPRPDLLALLRNIAGSLRTILTPGARACLERHFDEPFYIGNDRFVVQAGSPLVHYLLYGHAEGRSPSPEFDGAVYLDLNPDVAVLQLNPLLHFALFGQGEGRRWRLPSLGATPSCSRAADASAPSAASPPCYVCNDWLPDVPLVSVVIICFNYGRYVRQALESVLNQTLGGVEVIIVEGGSTDGATPEAVRQLEAEKPPGVVFLYRDRPCLPANNRNAGISLSRGRYVCCLDADDILRPSYLEVALFLAEAYGYDFVYPSVECFGASEEVWTVADPRFPEILDANQVSTVALFRRSAWSHVGGQRDWPRDVPYVPEDWDFWVRLLAHGFAGKRIRAPLMRYRVHDRSLTYSRPAPVSEQAVEIRKANAYLAEQASYRKQVEVRDPWVNLHRRPVGSANKPAIWFALPFSTIGGADKVFTTLAKGLSEDYQLIVTGDLELPESMPSNWGVFEAITPFVYDLSRLFDEPAHRTDFIWRLLHIHNFKIIYLAGSAAVYRLLPRIRADFPDVSVVDQIFNDSGHLKNNRRYAEFIDLTIVPSEGLMQRLVDDHQADPDTVVVVPHGIEAGSERGAEDCLPGLKEGQVVISFFGRLSSEKGPEVFVEIVNRLRNMPDLYFCMTGDGPERSKTLGLISRQGLADKIYAPGFVRDVAPLRRASDIVVLPSWIDGMPLTVLEAQAAGKPVVASRVGSLPAVILDGETGFLCASGDVDAFCEKILTLSREPELRATMGAKGQARAKAMFGAEEMVSRYRAAMDKMMDRRKRGGRC